jgi:Dual specificity phosphatase, catalytic domain
MKARPRAVVVALAVAGLLAALGLLGVARWIEGGPNYSRVEDGLYVGGYVDRPPRGTRAVLNVGEQEDPYEAEAHLWRPIKDAEPAPSVEWLREAVAFVEANRAAGRTTFVHCRNGVSRSGLVVVAYLMRKHARGRDEALAFARRARPELRPNPAFMRLLLEWEKEVKRAS